MVQIMVRQRLSNFLKRLFATEREDPQSSFRFEKKFVIPIEELDLFIAKIESYGVEPIFHERWINNMYFDTESLTHLNENIEGLSQRKKMRLRWYGDRLGELKLTGEFKIKQEDVNRKHSKKLGKYQRNLEHDILGIMDEALNRWKEKDEDASPLLDSYKPVLENRYKRRYYLSPDGSLRITVDTLMTYKNWVTGLSATTEENAIIEVKSNVESPLVNDQIPYSLSKSSKYVEGLMKTDPNYRLSN